MIARELIAKKRREEKADSTIGKMEWLLRLAEPALGSRLIRDVSAAEILVVLQQHEQRGHREAGLLVTIQQGRNVKATAAAVRTYLAELTNDDTPDPRVAHLPHKKKDAPPPAPPPKGGGPSQRGA